MTIKDLRYYRYYSQGIHPKIRPLANSKTKNNHIIVRWRSSLKDLIRDRKNNYRK